MICSMFGIQHQSCVSETIHAVSEALDNGDKSFTKRNLGFGPEHLTRETALKDHSRRMYYNLFKETDQYKIFLIMDGTYIYIEKSGDIAIQKKTFSGQKKRNLIKFFMIILPSGYILHAGGPYYADGNLNKNK